MRTMMTFLFAAAILIMASATAQAYTNGTKAIDSNGVAVVSIAQPSYGMAPVASSGHVYLDSNHVFAANDLKGSQFFASEKKETGKFVCMDSINRFCARSY